MVALIVVSIVVTGSLAVGVAVGMWFNRATQHSSVRPRHPSVAEIQRRVRLERDRQRYGRHAAADRFGVDAYVSR